MPVRLGYIDYLNCLPVYLALERGAVDLPVELVRGVPTQANAAFLAGEVDITPISSIEYARHPEECLILPDLSISADGEVGSILLFSRVPPGELDGRRICLPSSSATSVVLLKILLHDLYRVQVSFRTRPPDLAAMLAEADAALLIGDDALVAAGRERDLVVTDLGRAWKELTGQVMVYALWVVRRRLAQVRPDLVGQVARAFRVAKEWGFAHPKELVAEGSRRRDLPPEILSWYFGLIRHEFGPAYRAGLTEYYRRAAALGLLERVPPLALWGQAA
ncbi:MAG: menaquinone biosynthesis protein [Thermaerobacter sp.]|jgi:chorismate dehydratase|nr:menaquinone biosynthesis protein [Thermaerobacter sp.]